MGLSAWTNRVAGFPARTLLRATTGTRPQKVYDGIRFVVADVELTPSAERFFNRTTEALTVASLGAPSVYAKLQSDVEMVLLWGQSERLPHHQYLLALIVPPPIALQVPITNYAVWMLFASGLFTSQAEAQARADEFFASLSREERDRTAEWLTSEVERSSR